MFKNLDSRVKLLGLVWCAVLALGILAACSSKPAVYEPNEVQRLKLENIQLKERDAWKLAQQAVQDFNVIEESRKAACVEIAKQNKWPSETVCEFSNPNDVVSKLVFKVPVKKADTKEPAKK